MHRYRSFGRRVGGPVDRTGLPWRRALLAAVVVAGACGHDDGAGGETGGTDAPGAADPAPVLDERRDTLTPATAASDSLVLSPDGWGPLRIGMTREEVVAALGEDANPDAVGGPEPEVCDEWRPSQAPAGLLVMVERGRLTRITLLEESEIPTGAGVRVGDPVSSVRAAHGPDAVQTPHKYVDPPAEYITVWTSGLDSPEPRGLVYEIGSDATVTRIHAGGRSISYVEGCL